MRVENVRDVMIKLNTDQENRKRKQKRQRENKRERRVGRSSNSTQEKK